MFFDTSPYCSFALEAALSLLGFMSLSLYRAKSPLLGQHSHNAASVVQDSQSDQCSGAESASFIISFNGLLDDHYL